MKVKIDATKTKPKLIIEYYDNEKYIEYVTQDSIEYYDNEGLERILEKLKIEL